MKAVLLERFGEPAEVLHLGERSPAEPASGQVRVRMQAAPINPSDLMVARGKYGQLPVLPAVPGFEGVGVVEKSGGGLLPWLRGLRPGRRVAVIHSAGGTWQEQVVLSARLVVPLPDDVPDEQGASFFVNPATAVVLTRHVLGCRRGGILLQTAAGSALASMIRRLGKEEGFRVVDVVRRKEQADQLRSAGAWEVIATDVENLEDRIRTLTEGRGVDWAIDAVGGATGAAALRCLAPGSRLVVYGTLSGEPIPIDPRELMAQRKSIEGFWLGHWAKAQRPLTMLRLFRRITNLLRRGVLTTPVGPSFPLDRIAEAVQAAESPGKFGKVLLRMV